jgi:hypothetical protein
MHGHSFYAIPYGTVYTPYKIQCQQKLYCAVLHSHRGAVLCQYGEYEG